MNTKLIQCRDHSWCPWSVVCIHLIDGKKDWHPVSKPEENEEEEYDWLCQECLDKLENGFFQKNREDMLNLLKAVCMHCVRTLREQNDPNYVEE